MEVITAVGLWNVSNDDIISLTFFDGLDYAMETTLIGGGPPLFGGIINTAGASRVEIEHGIEARFEGYVTKPINVPEVIKGTTSHIG
mgnify:CR=1 FL=1